MCNLWSSGVWPGLGLDSCLVPRLLLILLTSFVFNWENCVCVSKSMDLNVKHLLPPWFESMILFDSHHLLTADRVLQHDGLF